MKPLITLRFIFATLLALGGLAGTPAHAGIDALQAGAAGTDGAAVRGDVQALAELARKHLRTVGLRQALEDFRSRPWQRDANALHLWGVTRSGMHWFDAGHPEIIGLDVSEMADIEGRVWFDMAIASAEGTGEAVFELLFPHPRHGRAARNLNRCFLLEDGERVLCAGAYVDNK